MKSGLSIGLVSLHTTLFPAITFLILPIVPVPSSDKFCKLGDPGGERLAAAAAVCVGDFRERL